MTQETWHEWADKLYRWNLSEIAASFLEAAGPLTLLGAQAIYLGQPLLTTFTAPESIQSLAELLETPAKKQEFIEILRTYIPENSSGGFSP
ncbi:MAG: hypothetical protein DRI56_10215 [Chloroflexota bacterium]|nr:MAG: hypothetical protein B6243_03935 [Anaerolineaceae bacterium 4572_5.2]RLD05021.1 MAG: hypothetical protein DRI56_10215 [Chloroflexota bacterium]